MDLLDYRNNLFRQLKLYAIYNTPSINLMRWLEEVIQAGFGTLQIRDKTGMLADDLLRAVVRRAEKSSCMVIINDDVLLAERIGAHGVHLGTNDASIAEVRTAYKNWIIGASARDTKRASQAMLEGADYLGVGPVYDTSTKENLPAAIGWQGFDKIASSTPLPCVAIGGLGIPQVQALENRSDKAIGLAFCQAVATEEKIRQLGQEIQACF